jgi:hypothetical protein
LQPLSPDNEYVNPAILYPGGAGSETTWYSGLKFIPAPLITGPELKVFIRGGLIDTDLLLWAAPFSGAAIALIKVAASPPQSLVESGMAGHTNALPQVPTVL